MHHHTLPEILTSYITSLRNHQPHGPYHLGGWSAGGVLAYAIAQRLLLEGEEISTLHFIDSPPPTKGLDRLPDRFFDHCSDVGIFGKELLDDGKGKEKTKVPDWLMPHFRATIELLHEYVAEPMNESESKKMKVTIVWAGTSPFDEGKYAPLPTATAMEQNGDGDGENEGMKFLTQKRRDFGPGDWAELFPGGELEVHVVEGEHHFSMMRGEGAGRLVGFLRRGLGVE